MSQTFLLPNFSLEQLCVENCKAVSIFTTLSGWYMFLLNELYVLLIDFALESKGSKVWKYAQVTSFKYIMSTGYRMNREQTSVCSSRFLWQSYETEKLHSVCAAWGHGSRQGLWGGLGTCSKAAVCWAANLSSRNSSSRDISQSVLLYILTYWHTNSGETWNSGGTGGWRGVAVRQWYVCVLKNFLTPLVFCSFSAAPTRSAGKCLQFFNMQQKSWTPASCFLDVVPGCVWAVV